MRSLGPFLLILAMSGFSKSPSLLPAPERIKAEGGTAQITLRWSTVSGAVGYRIYRATSPEGPFVLLDHGGGDVLEYPLTTYVDTAVLPGHTYWYQVAAVASKDGPSGEPSPPVAARPEFKVPPPLLARVSTNVREGSWEPVWEMVGSEHLSLLLSEERIGGIPIGEDLEQAFRRAHRELGVRYVRAHAILSDDLEVYREVNGRPRYDFSRIAQVYDRLLATGLKPVVELSFMPRDLAKNPEDRVFLYGAIPSPPKSFALWGELVGKLTRFLVERYGLEEVRQWAFEVWNEPNLDVFYTGNPRQASYFRLYETAARAIKAVDGGLRVGGPATAAAGWIEEFLSFVTSKRVPLDFVSSHTYGNYPLRLGEALKRYGLQVPVWWTEWGPGPSYNNPEADGAFPAPFALNGIKAAQGQAAYLAHWVLSDLFEELGRPGQLFHGGFGLLTVGGLRKPKYWAFYLANQARGERLKMELFGDGAGSLIDGVATRKSDGSIHVLLWNGSLDHGKASGHPLLDRRVRLCLEGLEGRYRAFLARVDNWHSNILARYRELYGFDLLPDWPRDSKEWEALREADRLDERELALPEPENGACRWSWTLDLPNPGVLRLRLEPLSSK